MPVTNEIVSGQIQDPALAKFMQLFVRAIRSIPHDYYYIDVAGQNNRIIQERIYAYELYHRFRTLQGDDDEFHLMGEVVKDSYTQIRELIARRKPDLIFHHAGHEANIAICEIKLASNTHGIAPKEDGTLQGIVCALDTLHLGITNLAYRAGILLIIGEHNGSIRQREQLHQRAEVHEDIVILWHYPNCRLVLIDRDDTEYIAPAFGTGPWLTEDVVQ